MNVIWALGYSHSMKLQNTLLSFYFCSFALYIAQITSKKVMLSQYSDSKCCIQQNLFCLLNALSSSHVIRVYLNIFLGSKVLLLKNLVSIGNGLLS